MFRVIGVCAASFFLLSAPANAQRMGNGLDIRSACSQMGELARGLDRVIDEDDLYGNKRAVWKESRGCIYRDPRDVKIETVRFLGWYLTTAQGVNRPQFWIPIYHVEFNATLQSKEILPGVIIRQKTGMFRANGALRTDRWRLPRGCESEWVERKERYKPIRLHGTDRQGGLPDCENPEYVGQGFKESRPRRR